MKTRLLLLAVTLLCAGCALPAPRAIVLPATHVVRAAVANAKASNARAVALATRIERTGVAAGSAEARDLLLDTTATDSQLADALAKVDALTAQLLTAQKKVDAQTQGLASLTVKYNAAVKTIWWYREHFLFPLLLAVALLVATVAVILLAKFTRWGAQTFGPYLVDAEHVAIEAAVHA